MVLPAVAASGLSANERGELRLGTVPFHGVGVNCYDAFTRTLGKAARTNYDAGFRELAARKIPFARFSAGDFWPQDWGLYQTNRAEHFARLDGVVKSAERHGIGLIPSLVFWKQDTREQFAEMRAADNPSPMNTLCVRGYDLITDIERLAQAMTLAQSVKKPLFVGEFGVPGVTTAESNEKFAAILAAIETNRVPLSALWVFDFASQAKDWNVNATNERMRTRR
jgi:hypothetical protein